MNRRPMWRWKSFWLGVLVLVFLVWAWVRSMTLSDTLALRYVDKAGKWGLASEDAGMMLYQSMGHVYVSLYIIDPFADDGVSHSVERVGDPAATGVAYAGMAGAEFAPFASVMGWGGDLLWMAHWFLCVVFLLVWGGWLGWRWRRESRVMRGEANVEHRTPDIE